MVTSNERNPRVDEEDDLDDLDDVLDQFSPQPQLSSGSPLPQPAPATSSTAENDVDFAAQLARDMESLFRGKDPEIAPREGSDSGLDGDATEQEQLRAAFEAMLVESMNNMPIPNMQGVPSPGSREGDDFQTRVRSTMNRLRESESGLNPSEIPAANGDAFQSLLSQLEGLGEPTGEESEDQLKEMLEAMMGQLLSKEVLYEPLKELHEKFPGYLNENRSTISPEDKKRYDAQISCIKRFLDAFGAETYQDDDENSHKEIVDLMTELQALGSPPEEIMGPLPPGLNMGTDGLPDIPDCNVN